MTKKGTGSAELRRIGEAIDESILNASSAEFREEAAAQGLDVDKLVAEMDAILQTPRARAPSSVSLGPRRPLQRSSREMPWSRRSKGRRCERNCMLRGQATVRARRA